MSTWMLNGPGQAFFIGSPGASQFNPSGSVSPGQGYVPDEVAKMLVKEAGLRKSDTVSKRVIVGYLESMGLSAGLAPDVAMVLRNVYGVTPTFDESTAQSTLNLLAELRGSLNESYPAPFKIDAPEILNEVDELIAAEYAESSDEVYDVVLEHLAGMDTHDVLDILEFYEWVGPRGFAYLADLVENGPEGLAEEVLEGICHPEEPISEAVQYHIEAMKIPDVKPLPKDKQDALRKKREAGMKAQREKPVSARTQMKKHAKDVSGGRQAEDPLKQRRAQAQRTGVSAMKGMSPAERSSRLAALKDRQSQRQATKKKASDTAMSRHLAKGAEAGAAEYKKKLADKAAAKKEKWSARKEKGKKALGFMKKVAGGAAKAVGKVAGAALKGTGYVAGATAGGVTKGLTDTGLKRSGASGDDGGQAASAKSGKKSGGATPEKKPGILHRVARGIGRFAAAVKQGYKDRTPGIQSQTGGGKDKKEKEKPAGGVAPAASVRDSVYRQGPLMNEMVDVLSGGAVEDFIPGPSDVLESFSPTDLVSQAVIEAVSQLDWDEVSQIASIAMLPIDEAYNLITAYQDGQTAFFHEWRDVSSRVDMPLAFNKGSLSVLAELTMDEGVIPSVIEWAIVALQNAGDDVASCVEDAYPDLGATVYGPAGDPKRGPELAKSYMSPYRHSTDAPAKGQELMTTRMFSDPDERAKERSSRLADVVSALRNMDQAAAGAGVDPEGMFLNTYRDLHREKARYS